MEHLTLDTFKEKIFEFEQEEAWAYQGSSPAVIDFYAHWCGPCRMVAPILEKMATEFEGKVDIYKVNTENEQELAALFQIQSIPSILFIPVEGKPQMSVGALNAEGFRQAFASVFNLS